MTLSRLRRTLLALFMAAALGTGLELILLGHTEDPWQWVPVVLTLGSPLVAAWYGWDSARAPAGAGRDRRASRRAFQGTMALFVASAAVGLTLHYRSNVEFALEMEPGARGLALAREALTGAIPALAPGTMLLLGAIGLIASAISEESP